jgi:hypothetical protein
MKRPQLFVVLISCLLLSLGGAAPTPRRVELYKGHLYMLTSAPKSWDAAQREARRLGGNLVTVNDALESAWLVKTFAPSYAGKRAEVLWIGLTDRVTEGIWKWVSGEPVTFTNWGGIEPNNFLDEDYALLQTVHTTNPCCGGPGRWLDIWSAGHGSTGNWPHGLLANGTGQYGIIEIDPQHIAL